jgi:hypothetical protein
MGHWQGRWQLLQQHWGSSWKGPLPQEQQVQEEGLQVVLHG